MTKSEIIKQLAEYKTKFQNDYGIIELGLFGSVAREQNNSESDIDVFIETVTPNPFIIVQIKEDLENIFKSKVDIVRKRKTMNPFLKSRIESEGVYV